MSSYAVSADGPNYEAVNHNRLRVTRVGIQDNGPSCHQPLYVLNQGLGVSDWLPGIQGLGVLGDRWQRMQDLLRQSNKPQPDNSGQEGHLDVADPAMTTSEAILAIEFSPSAEFWPSENTASAGYNLGGGSRDISLTPLPDKVFALESTTNENNPLMTWQAADSEPEESNVEGGAVAQGNGFDSTLNGPDSFLLLEGITSPSLDQTSVEAPLINLFPTLLETQGKAENMDAFALRDLLAPTVEAPHLTLDWPAVSPQAVSPQAVLYWSIDLALTEPLSTSTPELDLVISPSAVFGSRIEEDLEPPPEIPEPGTAVALLLALGGLKVLKRKS
ncbi:MAG: PEP-CTERM sorting domain-containing protein, partial [Cyanobacteria bacterium P01_F01_bin.86]